MKPTSAFPFILSIAIVILTASAQAQRGTPPSKPVQPKPAQPPTSQGRGQPPANPGSQGKAANPTPPAGASKTAPEHLAVKPQLSTRLQPLLPPGTDIQAASLGFKNLGAFVSAVHVSNNLGIPFSDLKLRVTGTNAVSLGKAIQQLKPAANATAEVSKAESQARKDMAGGK
jgi:hypothetical protein